MQAEIRKTFAGAKKDGGSRRRPFFETDRSVQERRVNTKFFPAASVQLSWLMDTNKQFVWIGVWRINEVPVISSDVAPVMV